MYFIFSLWSYHQFIIIIHNLYLLNLLPILFRWSFALSYFSFATSMFESISVLWHRFWRFAYYYQFYLMNIRDCHWSLKNQMKFGIFFDCWEGGTLLCGCWYNWLRSGCFFRYCCWVLTWGFIPYSINKIILIICFYILYFFRILSKYTSANAHKNIEADIGKLMMIFYHHW